MKLYVCTLFAGLFFSCASEREIQADIIDASLVKIDIINRYPNLQRKMLTWLATDNVLYITYEPVNSDVAIGTTRKMMARR